jgi:hypothetical protein
MKDKTTLGISILNGELKAASLGQGSGETWESPALSDNFADLGPILAEAANKTRAEGKQVSIVLAHPRLIDRVVEIPPVKGWQLDRLLHRQAQATKAFVGEAVWSRQAALPTKQNQAAFLHLCSKTVLDQLAKSCADAQLQLVRLIPTTAVLINHLKALPLQKDEVALLAAETGTGTSLIIGRKDGRACLGRVLRSSWNTNPESVGVELTRSIGFAEQQTGLTVTSVWLFGARAQEQAPRIEALLKLPAKVSPIPYSPFYWAEQAARLPEGQDGNFVSVDTQQAPSRRRFLNLTVCLLCLLGVVTLATVIVTEMQRRKELRSVAALSAKNEDLRMKQKKIQATLDDLAQRNEMVRVISGEKPVPVPNWFMGYLGEVMPDDLVLSQVRIALETNDFWSVHLAGAGEPRLNHAGMLRLAVTSFSNVLANGPFHMKIINAAPDKTAGASPARRGSRAERLEKDANTFVIDGVMR